MLFRSLIAIAIKNLYAVVLKRIVRSADNNARTLIRKLDRDELLQTLVRSYLGK